MDHSTGFVLFANRKNAPEHLVEILKKLNIQINPSQQSNTHGICVAIVHSQSPIPQSFLKTLQYLKLTSPCLFVLLGDPRDLPKQILEVCDDFIFWPCTESELTLRFNKLKSQACSHKSDIQNAEELMQQIAKLNLIGSSKAFTNTLDLIQKISKCDAPAFIDGETGTGKELAARAIHLMSARKNEAFIAINCGAIPESLVESELFGNVKGAFTDAKCSRKGLIAQANKGTLFLDEVDTLSVKSQIVLLRFLQDQKYRAVGSANESVADVRIIAATNQVAKTLLKKENFRKDLFFRLYIMNITIPPLRTRVGDVALLANYFFQVYEKKYKKKKSIGTRYLTWLEAQYWEGNVRELENHLHRVFLTEDAEHINYSPDESDATSKFIDIGLQTFNTEKTRIIESFEQHYLNELLEKTQGNVSEAARQAGKERRALGKLINKYDIDVAEFRKV